MSKSRVLDATGRAVHVTSRADAIRRLAGWVVVWGILGALTTWATASAGLLRVGWFPMVVCLAIGVVLWSAIEGMGESATTTWNRHVMTGAGVAQPDPSTTRLMDDLQRAGHGSPAGICRVADFLMDATAARLIAHHGADPADPWAEAERHLSPALVSFLSSAHDENPLAISPATLSTYLTEIEQL